MAANSCDRPCKRGFTHQIRTKFISQSCKTVRANGTWKVCELWPRWAVSKMLGDYFRPARYCCYCWAPNRRTSVWPATSGEQPPTRSVYCCNWICWAGRAKAAEAKARPLIVWPTRSYAFPVLRQANDGPFAGQRPKLISPIDRGRWGPKGPIEPGGLQHRDGLGRRPTSAVCNLAGRWPVDSSLVPALVTSSPVASWATCTGRATNPKPPPGGVGSFADASRSYVTRTHLRPAAVRSTANVSSPTDDRWTPTAPRRFVVPLRHSPDRLSEFEIQTALVGCWMTLDQWIRLFVLIFLPSC